MGHSRGPAPPTSWLPLESPIRQLGRDDSSDYLAMTPAAPQWEPIAGVAAQEFAHGVDPEGD